MRTVLVGVFDELDGATRAREALLEAGFDERNVSIRTKAAADDPTRSHPAIVDNRSAVLREELGLTDWLRSLFGDDSRHEDAAARYVDAFDRGAYLLTVDDVRDDQVQRVSDIIEQHGPIEIDEDAQPAGGAGTAASGGAPLGGAPLPGVAGRPSAAGPTGIRTDVDQDFGHRELEDDHRYQLDERGYPPLENADPVDIAAHTSRLRRRVGVIQRPDPKGGGPR